MIGPQTPEHHRHMNISGCFKTLFLVTMLIAAWHSLPHARAQEAAPGSASAFPTKPTRMVVNFPAGGPSDAVARPLAQRLTEIWGQQVVVDFRGGAAGNIGADHVAKSAPDGYTYLLISGSFLTNPSVTPNMPFDSIRDFAPISPVASSGIVLVTNPALPVKSVKDLIALARKHPDKLTFASSGSGGSLHLFAELFKLLSHTRALHVPYKGAGPALIEVVGGQVDMMFIALPPTLPHIKNGRLRALGLGNAKRSPALPDVPTIAEQGVAGYEVSSHFGMLAPGGTPREVVARLNTGLVQALQSSYIKERYAAIGTDAVYSSPEAYASFIRTEIGKWAQVVKKAGIRND